MLERITEQKLVDTVKAKGGMVPKFINPGNDRMPDRIILLPGGRIYFVGVWRRWRKRLNAKRG